MDKDEVIRKALRFPIEPVVDQYIKNYGVTADEAHEHELELKRYLALSALNPGKSYVVNAPIRNILQTFIISTMLYAEFCSTVAGGFIHYTPTEVSGRSKIEIAQEYTALLEDYEFVFNAPPPQHIWPRVGELDSNLPPDRDSLDAFTSY
jgi:hypothetical protein